MARERFFVSTGDNLEYYETREEAKAAAEFAIAQWKDCCDPEWPEEVEAVCWGVILERAKGVITGENNEYVNYELDPLYDRSTQEST